MKRSYKTNNNKKAFTLIELLIVIAIIGILFIVLVSKVDFATDKAKASGVQTDFRSFQLALDQVAKENTGFNTFGWDTGDDNGDRIRNSYDRGDTNKNGKEDPGETFIGRKTYGEDWTSIYTMLNPDTTKADDTSAFVALEQAINANLDPKLHITITPDVDGGALTGNATITMANQARDPWKNEYHGVFITNANRDNGADRGAIIIYSDGANGVWGSAHDITNGLVTISVPGNNKNGQDDYSIVSCYTYVNGYGEVLNMTTGFSTNQQFLNNGNNSGPVAGGNNGGSGNGNGNVADLNELQLNKAYAFKSSYDVDSIFQVASQSFEIDTGDDGLITSVLYGDDQGVLLIAGFLPSEINDAYVIMHMIENGGFVYVSNGMCQVFKEQELSNFEGYDEIFKHSGWYTLLADNEGNLQGATAISAPSITFLDSGTICVPELNSLLPLFSDVEVKINIKFDRWYSDEDGGSLMFVSDGGLIANLIALPTEYITITPSTIIIHQPDGQVVSSAPYVVYNDGKTINVNGEILTLDETNPQPIKPQTNVYYKHGGMVWNGIFTLDGGFILETSGGVSYYDPSRITFHGKHFYLMSGSGEYASDYKHCFSYNSEQNYIADFDFVMSATAADPLKVVDKVVYSADYKTCLGYSNQYDTTLTDVVITEGTTKIARSFFASRTMKTLTIPASVTTMENANFAVFEGLTDIYFQGTAQQWAAFGITLPAGVNVHFN